MIPLLALLTPLLAQPTVQEGIYSSGRVRQLVAAAAGAHARPPRGLASYRARMETELGFAIHRGDGTEVPVQAEQVASEVSWWRDGTLSQRVVGYRARSMALNISALSYMEAPWGLPPLYGDRIRLLLRPDSLYVRAERESGGSPEDEDDPPPKYLVHPFASDREAFYRFGGGDTVEVLRLPARDVTVLRITVEPTVVPREHLVFSGEVHLDADTRQIVRMRGYLDSRPRRRRVLAGFLGALVEGHFLLELQNAEWEGAYWLPWFQRIELQAVPTMSEARSIFRTVTRFREMAVNGLPPSVSRPGPPRRTLSWAAGDSLRAFEEWKEPLGEASTRLHARDLDDVAPDALRSGGPPRLRWGTRRFTDLLRYDRVEGLYTGFGARVELRDAAPGAFLGVHAGWAWAEGAVRGGAEAGVRRGGWSAGVRAARVLASTNDFTTAFDEGATVLGAFGIDEHDYVDRLSAVAWTAWRPAGRRLEAELEAGWARDGVALRNVGAAPIGGDSFPENRPVFPGDYARVRATLTWAGPSGVDFLRPGLGVLIAIEAAEGELSWRRVEARLRTRHGRGRLTAGGEVHAGALFSDAPPPQNLFEIGSSERLPGYDYKAFAGDRGVLLSSLVMYTLPVLGSPIRVGGVYLPAPAPAPSLEFYAGWTRASPDARPTLRQLGWVTSDGYRSTLALRLRLFGGPLSVGVARPLEGGRRWRGVVALAAPL